MKRILSICLVLILALSLSACSCNIDWSNFDLTKKNFGLTNEEKESSDTEEIIVSSSASDSTVVFSDEIINYIVPENSSVVYSQWEVASSEDFSSMANDKLLEIADLTAQLVAVKSELSEYSTVSGMASNENFSKILNNIRAWSFGARNYPADELSAEDAELLEKMIILGVDASEYGAKLPSLVITDNTETAGEYENLIISQIVALSSDAE